MNNFQVRLSAALVVVLLVSLTLLSIRTSHHAEALVVPEVAAKAETVGRSVAGLVGQALAYGIPTDRFIGLDDHLAGIVAANPDLAYIAVLTTDGRPLYSGGTPTGDPGTIIRVAPEELLGLVIEVDIDPAYVRDVVYQLWLDLAIVMVVTALVALELIHISFGIGLYGAIEGVEHRLSALRRGDLREHPSVSAAGAFGQIARRIDDRLAALTARLRDAAKTAAAVADTARAQAIAAIAERFRIGQRVGEAPMSVIAIRAPLFVFMFAEELTRPFLPVYIQGLAAPVPGLSPELVTSLPMVVFLAIVALAQPFLGTVTERAGRRRSLIMGAALGAAGYVATAFAFDLWGLTIARAMTAVGFALVFVAAQGFVIDTTGTAQRAKGMAMFIGAILVAGLCGPPIGGILADRLGMSTAFLIAGGAATASLILARIGLPERAGIGKPSAMIRWRDLGMVLRTPHLVALLVLCALPAKLILVAVAFFLVPLHLEATGQTQAAIGRLLMIYPLAMVLLVPAFASLARGAGQRVRLVALGGMVAGLGALIVLIDPDSVMAIGAVLLCLGLGQAMSIASQSALVGEFGNDLPEPVGEATLYGIFRLVERTGNALGPLVAGTLLGIYGFVPAVVGIGLGVAGGAALFALTAALAPRAGSTPPGAAFEGEAR